MTQQGAIVAEKKDADDDTRRVALRSRLEQSLRQHERLNAQVPQSARRASEVRHYDDSDDLFDNMPV